MSLNTNTAVTSDSLKHITTHFHVHAEVPQIASAVDQLRRNIPEHLNEMINNALLKQTASKDVEVLLKFLICGTDPSFQDISFSLIKSLLMQKDKRMLATAREVVKEIFPSLLKELKKIEQEKLSSPLPDEQEKLEKEEQMYEMIIGDLLTVYPFLEPHYDLKSDKVSDKFISIPQKIGGQWQEVKCELTAKKLGKKWMRPALYAYELTPENNPKASPMLLFMGTPPPTTSGEALAKWVDFIPGHTVGEALYDMSKKTIDAFIIKSQETNPNVPVRAYGKSLGGAMSLLTAVHWGDRVEAHAYNPPGLYSKMYNLYTHNKKEWSEQGRKEPDIYVYSQKNDPVSELMGKWPPNTQLYKIIPEEKTNIYYAHIQSFFGKKNVSIIKKENVEEINEESRRKVASIAHHIASFVFFIFNSLALLWSSARHAMHKKFKRIMGNKKPKIKATNSP
jgi:hypothetical protein